MLQINSYDTVCGESLIHHTLFFNDDLEVEVNIEKTIVALEKNGYKVYFFENKELASEYLNDQINDKTVGLGDSGTLMDMRLFESLSKHNVVYDPQHSSSSETFIETAKKCLLTEIFMTSVNALSMTGELVNIDGTGNRVAGSLFGHDKVYFVVGSNKLTNSLDDAIWRARNIAAPKNAKRLGLKTPCAIKGDKCYECSSPERICNGMIIHMKKMSDMDMEIILVDESLGL